MTNLDLRGFAPQTPPHTLSLGSLASCCGPALEALQLFDERRAFQVQELRRLYFVSVRALERSLDQRQLDTLDVAFEVHPLVRKPAVPPVRHGRNAGDFGS